MVTQAVGCRKIGMGVKKVTPRNNSTQVGRRCLPFLWPYCVLRIGSLDLGNDR